MDPLKRYVDYDEVPSIVLDKTIDTTLSSLPKMSTEKLEESSKNYKCNYQVAALMANVGDIKSIPEDCVSRYAGKKLKMSIYRAWSEIYNAAMKELEVRSRVLTLI